MRSPSRRSGFTLIELLVAITIFSILAALAIGSFKGVSKDDRIRAGTQQVKGWFEHARSMAIHDKAPRGIRFLPDANNPRLCTTIAYIGGTGYEEGDLTASAFVDQKYLLVHPNSLTYAGVVWPAGSVLSPGGPDSLHPASTAIDGYAGYLGLQSLVETGALGDASVRQHGLRIEIPRGSGQWYPINIAGEDRNNDKTLDTAEDANGNGTNDPLIFLGKPLANWSQMANQRLDYRLEIGPTVLPEEANPLARGVVIDLDASLVPDIWRPAFPATEAVLPYSSNMDILFSPQGTFTGQLAAAQGAIHLCVSTLEDAEKARINSDAASGNIHPVNVTTSTTPTTFARYPYILADPATSQRFVSAYLTSGRISSSEIDTGSGDTDSKYQNERAGTSANSYLEVFTYALRGKEAK